MKYNCSEKRWLYKLAMIDITPTTFTHIHHFPSLDSSTLFASFAWKPVIRIPKEFPYDGYILGVIRAILESLQIWKLLVSWLYILVTRIVSLYVSLHSVPIPACSFLTISRTKSMNRIERYISRRVVRWAHCVLSDAIKTMKNMRPFHTLRFVLSILLDWDV